MEIKQPKLQRRFVTDTTGSCLYKGENVAAGVPCIPYMTVISSVANDNWNSSWTIPHGCRAFEIKLREEVNLKIATDSSGSPYFTVRASANYVESLIVPEMYGYEEGTVLYFQVASGTGNVEIIYWLDGTECHTPS